MLCTDMKSRGYEIGMLELISLLWVGMWDSLLHVIEIMEGASIGI